MAIADLTNKVVISYL